jgi:hypothetical protein
MNPIEPLQRAALLKTEADRLLEHLGLAEMLQRASGRVDFTGSYLLDMMAYPDIDVMAGRASIEQVFAVGAQLARRPGVIELVFQPSRDPDLPGGLYLKPRVAWGDWGRPWKIDIWFLEEVIIERKLSEMRRFQAGLTPELRSLILSYKQSILTAERRTPMGSGYWIYRAVLEDGLRGFDELSAYLRAHQVEV